MKFALALVLLAVSGGYPQLSGQIAPRSGDEPATAPSLPSRNYGKIEGETYLSPTGLYRMKIPVLAELGGAVSDTPNVVTFDDDYRIHLSVAAFPLSRDLKAEFDTRGPKDFLINFFTGIVMPDFVANFPGSSVEQTAAFLPQFQGGSILIFTLHPGGSNFERRSTVSRAVKPVVAKRGNLCFVRSGYVFIISTELAERALERSTYKKTPEEENVILRQRLLEIASKMQIAAPMGEPKN
jgi:hypothetical protein